MKFKVIVCMLAVALLSAFAYSADDDNEKKKGEIPQDGGRNPTGIVQAAALSPGGYPEIGRICRFQ
jgi:hypothetical protein